MWSFEGSKGYGTHADYLFGWKGDSLQRAMNKSECFYDGCGSITKQAMTQANKCTVKDIVGEKTDGCASTFRTRPPDSYTDTPQGSHRCRAGRPARLERPTWQGTRQGFGSRRSETVWTLFRDRITGSICFTLWLCKDIVSSAF